MRDSIQAPHPADNSNSKQKKKKQRKERQAQQHERNQAFSTTGGSSKQSYRSIAINPSHDVSRTSHPDDYSAMPPIMHLPYDAYPGYLPLDPYQMHAGFPFSPMDEYHPTDGPLWNIAERPSTLSPYAMPWFPSYAPPMLQPEPVSYPPRLPSPPPTTAALSLDVAVVSPAVPQLESRSDTSLSSPMASLLEGPFDSNLSGRLRQLEALSASLLALTNGPSPSASTGARAPGPVRAVSPLIPPHISHPPTRSQTADHSSFAELPAKPAVPAPEALKRMIGIPDDKCNFGYFDLTAHHLEPPPLAKVAPPIPAHTIVLAQIPKKFRNERFVRPWAKRYGNALRISLDVRAGKALIEWGNLAAAEAAFTSMRLRGDGKEHIRAYRYIGVKSVKPKEMEEGEIEEGEVVETKAKKKKKNKGKAKAQLEQQRFNQPAPTRVPPPSVSMLPPAPPLVPFPVAAPPPPATHDASLHLPPRPMGNEAIASPADIAAIIAAATALRPAFEGLPHRPPSVPSAPEVEEEAMELDSDGEEERTPLPTPPTLPTAVASGGQAEARVEVITVEKEGEGIAEEDMEVDDEDMEMSSPIEGPPVPLVQEPSPPPRLSDTASTPMPADSAPPPPVDEVTQAAQAARGVRRRKLEEAIVRTKAQLALRESALSSRPSIVSISGNSESPEPPTPVDLPHSNGLEVAVASTNGDVVMVDSDLGQAANVTVKNESTLDDLAVSFIAESIQTVSASSSSPSSSSSIASQLPATSSTTMLASVELAPPTPMPRPNPIPIAAPVPTLKVAIMQPPAAPTPLTEEQKQAKEAKWLEHVSGCRSLMGKIAAAKNKDEKNLLMRMLKAKTK